MSSIIADTHTIVWFLEDPTKLSRDAERALADAIVASDDKIFISAISLIEIQYLIEKQRISPSVLNALLSELQNPEPIIEIIPVDLSVAVGLTKISRADVPEMPDRIIAVTALLLNLALITADKAIRSSGISVIW